MILRAQNTTIEQMKMFLTRLGFGSRPRWSPRHDPGRLPKHVKSGLKDGIEVLRDVNGVSFTFSRPATWSAIRCWHDRRRL